MQKQDYIYYSRPATFKEYKVVNSDLESVLNAWKMFEINKDLINLDSESKFIIENVESIIITSLKNFDTSIYLNFFIPNYEELRDEFLIESNFFNSLMKSLIDNYDTFAEDILKSNFFKSLTCSSINGVDIFEYSFNNSRFEICELLNEIEFFYVKHLMEKAISEDSIVMVKCLLSLKNISPIFVVNYAMIATTNRKLNVLRYLSSIIGISELNEIRDGFYDIICENFKKMENL